MADSGTIEGNQNNSVISDFWPDLNVDGPYFDVEECAQAGDSMATFVLDQFNIPYNGSDGGPLGSIDIKRMNAMTVINQSLMEDITDGYLKEPIVNEYGEVEFVKIGQTGGNISDVYYTVQTSTLVDDAKGVMVTGKRPLPLKRAIEWKPIWGEIDSSYHLYSYQDMLVNCNLDNFSRYATITFNDPYLDTKYEDGIDNLFDITNPWETLMGYIHYKKIPQELVERNRDYTVNYTNTATVPIRLPDSGLSPEQPGVIVEYAADMGARLATFPQYDVNAGPEECWSDPNQGEPVNFEDGVAIPIREEEYADLIYDDVRETKVDKFVRVSGVFVIGVEVDYIRTAPASDVDATLANQGQEHQYYTWVSIEDKQRKAFKLTEGTHYGIAYDDESTEAFKTPYIVFVKDVRPSDPQPYGTGVQFYLYQGCKLARELNVTQDTGLFSGSILPIEKNRGILVEQIYAVIDLDSPSIVVQDPNGSALEIAENLNYYLGMMKVYQPPAPIGYAGQGAQGGTLVDQTTGVQDNDPTTALGTEQISELERYYDYMQGGGMALTLSFLEEDEVPRVAKTLYDYMNWNGTATVHTCGPCARPQLGRWGTSGVINSIQYSYSDKGSYTVSVQEGPYIVGGLTPVDGGPTQKAQEDQSFTGKIIKDAGNSVHFKVMLDGYGERWAMSTVPQILRVGDVVNCTVHNNPVEA